MGSARDRAPDVTRSSTEARPPLRPRPSLQPIAPTESRGAPLLWQEPLGPGGAVPAPSLRSPASPPPGRQPKLLDRLRDALRSRHYSHRTEQSYCHWVKRFIFFHNVRHPVEMAEPDINAFLTHLAIKGKVRLDAQSGAQRAPVPVSARAGPADRQYRCRRPRAPAKPSASRPDTPGGESRPRAPQGRPVAHGESDVRRRAPSDGMPAAAGSRRGPRGLPDRRAGWQGLQGSGNHAARDREASATGPPGNGQENSRARPCGRVRPGATAGCTGPQVPERGQGMGLAAPVPPGEALGESPDGRAGPPSRPIRRSSNGSSRPQPPRRGWPSMPPATACAIPSPHISWKTAMTSGLFRISSGIKT